MEFIKNKKGVSDVITTVLIILLVLAAVAIIGGILLRNISQAGGKIETSTGCVELDLQPVSCSGTQTGAGVLVQRGSRGSSLQISKLAAVVEKDDGTSTTGYAAIPNINPLATTLINVSGISGGNAKNARVSATLRGSDGSEQTCELTNVAAECKEGSGGVLSLGVVIAGVDIGTSSVTIAGSGYSVGAIAVFSAGCTTPAVIRITAVDSNGGIVSTPKGFVVDSRGSGCSPGLYSFSV